MGSLLEVLDKISREVSEETIKKMINLDDFYKLCVEYGYSATQDIFKKEYRDILEKSIDSLTKSVLSDDALDTVSGGISSQFKSGIVLIFASIGALSPSIGATSQKSSSVLSNQSAIPEKISGYTKSSKEYIASGLNYLKNGTKYLLDKGKEGLTKGLDYASKYGNKFVEYSSDAAKQTGNFIKAHPVESSVVGASSSALLGTGAILVNKLSSNDKKLELTNPHSSLSDLSENNKNQKNIALGENYFSNVAKFINSISPKSVNGKNTCDFVKLNFLKQKELISLCLQDLGINRELVLKNITSTEMITSCIKTLYTSISNILENNSKNQDILNELRQIQCCLVEFAKIYNVQLENMRVEGSEQNKQSEVTNSSEASKSTEANNIPLPTTTVKMNLNGVETEIKVNEKLEAGNYVQVCVNGKMVQRQVDNNMNIILLDKDIQTAKDLKEQKDLENKVISDLIEKDKKEAESYLKKYEKIVKESENKLLKFNYEIDELNKKICNMDTLLKDDTDELNELKKELQQAEDDYNEAKNSYSSGTTDLEEMQQRSKKASLNGRVETYKKNISNKEKEIDKNKEETNRLKTKRSDLMEETKRIDTDKTIKKYYQHKETIQSIENGTYKVDEQRINEEILRRKPTKTSSDLTKDLQNAMNRRNQFDPNQEDYDDEEEWSD